jgi:hypothetical protein
MKLQIRAALAIATLALVAAVSGIAGAVAGQVLITGKQIRNGSLTTQDYRKGSVRTSDVQNGTVASADLATEGVQSQDIGTNQVQPSDVEAPDPQLGLEAGAASAEVSDEFVPLDPIETYVKEDPTSILEVSWTGSASAGFLPCQFQLRVDGQAAAPGAGVIYVGNGSVNGNVMVVVDFFGLAVGPHEIAIYARSVGGAGSTCTVGPESAQITQTFITAEQVV